MISKSTLTALALAAAAFATSAVDTVQAASPVADFKLPPQLHFVGGLGHTPMALPMPPRCAKPKLPLPGCRIP